MKEKRSGAPCGSSHEADAGIGGNCRGVKASPAPTAFPRHAFDNGPLRSRTVADEEAINEVGNYLLI